ncbi:hypothetical protein GWI33_018138 [Rhynchophorus ferrugineus]|uniref:Uncharacterized protein n=1 Tax=Rhynchophorus ferrugineus TaxID=354439 RepID=A0A834HWY7_RHYFE|nr:hypothetical protein GWI33_018138 [Rhynchophorus ferrugineus]
MKKTTQTQREEKNEEGHQTNRIFARLEGGAGRRDLEHKSSLKREPFGKNLMLDNDFNRHGEGCGDDGEEGGVPGHRGQLVVVDVGRIFNSLNRTVMG